MIFDDTHRNALSVAQVKLYFTVDSPTSPSLADAPTLNFYRYSDLQQVRDNDLSDTGAILK